MKINDKIEEYHSGQKRTVLLIKMYIFRGFHFNFVTFVAIIINNNN